MISLLIVDDHPHQTDSIAHVITEARLPFMGNIHKAYSAREALERFCSEPIDIVITDIRMPEMNGVELIEKLREKSSAVKCVLLSGYAEFEYAQRAMELQTSKYLMKPVQKIELLTTLELLSEEITAERRSVQQHERTIHAMREHMPLVKGALLQDLVQGKAIMRRDLVRRLATL